MSRNQDRDDRRVVLVHRHRVFDCAEHAIHGFPRIGRSGNALLDRCLGQCRDAIGRKQEPVAGLDLQRIERPDLPELRAEAARQRRALAMQVIEDIEHAFAQQHQVAVAHAERACVGAARVQSDDRCRHSGELGRAALAALQMGVGFSNCVAHPVGRLAVLCAGLFANHAHELGGGFPARHVARGKAAKPVGDQHEPRAVRQRLDRERIFLAASRTLDLSPGDVHCAKSS